MKLIIKEISIISLQPGMIFAEDIRNKSGTLLVSRGHTVTQELLERLYNLPDIRTFTMVKMVVSDTRKND